MSVTKKWSEWSDLEDELLVDAVMEFHGKPWQTISTKMPGRDADECRMRYHRYVKNSKRFAGKVPVRVSRFKSEDDRTSMTMMVRNPGEPSPLPVEDEAFASLAADQLIDSDAFTFEEILNLGAQPHLSQPVTNDPPSPNTLAALPTWTQVADPVALQTTTTVVAPSLTSLPTFRATIVSAVKSRPNVAFLRPVYLDMWSKNIRFRDINSIINRPSKSKITYGAIAKKSVIVFNPALVYGA